MTVGRSSDSDQFPRAHRALRPNVERTLEEGRADRSTAQWTVLLGAVQAGWSDSEMIEALNNPKNTAGTKFQEKAARNHAAAVRWLVADIKRARRWVRDHPVLAGDRHAIAAEVAAIEAWVDEHAHLGKGRRSLTTDRLAIAALGRMAVQSGSMRIEASVRTLALGPRVGNG